MRETLRNLVKTKKHNFKTSLFKIDLRNPASLFVANSDKSIEYLGEIYSSEVRDNLKITYVSLLCSDSEQMRLTRNELLKLILVVKVVKSTYCFEGSIKIVDLEASSNIWEIGIEITQLGPTAKV